MASPYIIDKLRLQLSWEEFERALTHFQTTPEERMLGDINRIKDAKAALAILEHRVERMSAARKMEAAE
jgi:hypothetical protein